MKQLLTRIYESENSKSTALSKFSNWPCHLKFVQSNLLDSIFAHKYFCRPEGMDLELDLLSKSILGFFR